MKFVFVAKHRSIWPVAWLCDALGVSRSGFHAWLNRSPSARSHSDEAVGRQVKASFMASDRTYGARRVWRDLLADGVDCGLHRIERLMRLQALQARPRRRRLPKDEGDRRMPTVPSNILNRQFEAARPNQKWIHIKQSMVEPLRRQLGTYLSDVLARVPCSVSVKVPNFEREMKVGWTKNWEDFRPQLLLRGAVRCETAEEEARCTEWQTIVREPTRRMRFFGPSTGELPNALGTYRISIPYFSLDAGPSLKYLHKQRDAFQVCGWGHFVRPRPIVLVAWRGSTLLPASPWNDPWSNLHYLSNRDIPTIVEIDLDRGAVISVNRERLQIEAREVIVSAIETATEDTFSSFASAQQSNAIFASLSPKWISSIKSKADAKKSASHWFTQDGDLMRWGPVRFPALTYGSTDILQNRFRGIKSVLSKAIFYDERGYETAAPLANLRPSSIVFFGNKHLPYMGLRYERPSLNEYFSATNRFHWQLVDAEFPREMSNVVAIRSWGPNLILNRMHAIAKLASSAALETYFNRFGDDADEDVGDSLDQITDPVIAACWLISNLLRDTSRLSTVHHKFGTKLKAVLDLLGVKGPFFIWDHHQSNVVRTSCLDHTTVLCVAEDSCTERPARGVYDLPFRIPRRGSFWLTIQDGSELHFERAVKFA